MEQLCRTCVYRNDWADPGKCYADLEYHDADDTCVFWQGTLREQPLNDPPEVKLLKRVAELDTEVEG